jgi:hypothetical protein
MRFAGKVFVVDDIAIQLVADGRFASAETPGNVSNTVTFVAQYLDFVTFVLREVNVVFSS